MSLELIHADQNFNEIGAMDFARFDAVISTNDDVDSNDWEMQLPVEAFRHAEVAIGDFLYIPGTEFGGAVEQIEHISNTGMMKLRGVNWCGMLIRKIISPPAGMSHLDLSEVEVNEVIGRLVQDHFGGLFEAIVEDSGKLCGKRFRYQTVFAGIAEMVDELGMRLEVTFDITRRKVLLCARDIADHSEELEFSGDYDFSYTATMGEAKINHIIALGQGEQENRTVRHLYLLPDGSVTENADAVGVATGWKERAMVYDYPNCESERQLVAGAKQRLKKYAVQNAIDFSLDSTDINLPLGDKVGLRDRITGMADVKTISRKTMTISEDGVRWEYRVE